MNKALFILLALGLLYEISLCQIATKEKKISHEIQGMFIDLNTTDLVDLCYDSVHHKTVNLNNQKEIFFFINPETGDTLYGRGVYVVNGFVIKGTDNKFHLNTQLVKTDRGELKLKNQGTRLKISRNQIKNMNCTGKGLYEGDSNKSRQLDSRTGLGSPTDKNEYIKLKNESAKNLEKDKVRN